MDIIEKSYLILNDSNRTEEDRIEDVETHIREQCRSDLNEEEIERLVLDILLHHQSGKPFTAVAKPRVVAKVSSNPVRLPDVEQARKVAISQKPKPKQPKKQKWVSLDEVDIPEPVEKKVERSPYDILRDILGPEAGDEDIERVLAHNEFDIGRTIEMLIRSQKQSSPGSGDENGSKNTGKESEKGHMESMDMDEAREVLLTRNQTAERVMCKYFLKSGECMRGDDCMYSHDLSQRICRFWLQQQCLAGDSCVFLHEIPEDVIAQLTIAAPKTPKTVPVISKENLPTLGSKTSNGSRKSSPKPSTTGAGTVAKSVAKYDFSSLLKSGDNKEPAINFKLKRGKLAVTAPRLVPWKNPKFGKNQEYVDLRLAAKKDGELRNKYLELATNSWSRNDPAAAKAFSKKGQEFHRKMVDNQKQAGRLLFENRTLASSEIYVDLHGHELGAAIDHLEECLQLIEEKEGHDPRIVYVICGRGHFKTKRYADQLSQHVKVFLDKYGYAHKDFGEDADFGRVIGIDPWSALDRI